MNDDEIEWSLAFDVFRDWPWEAVALLLVPAMIAIVGLFIYRSSWGFRRLLGGTFLLIGVVVTVLGWAVAISDYSTVKQAYANGTYEVVEGEVVDFVSAHGDYDENTGRKGRPESFRVQDTRFSYHHRTHRCFCFNHTAFAGGPMKAGQYVRLRHLEGNILRIEIRVSQDN